MLYPLPIHVKDYSIGHKLETAQPKKKEKKVHLSKFFGSKFKIPITTEILCKSVKKVVLDFQWPHSTPLSVLDKGLRWFK